jgi:hypothetical protein
MDSVLADWSRKQSRDAFQIHFQILILRRLSLEIRLSHLLVSAKTKPTFPSLQTTASLLHQLQNCHEIHDISRRKYPRGSLRPTARKFFQLLRRFRISDGYGIRERRALVQSNLRYNTASMKVDICIEPTSATTNKIFVATTSNILIYWILQFSRLMLSIIRSTPSTVLACHSSRLGTWASQPPLRFGFQLGE